MLVPADNAFPNLGQAFDAQQEQAGLAKLLTDEQFKQIQALNDPANNLALSKQIAQAQSNRPQYQFGVSGDNAGEILSSGLGGGIKNYMSGKQYGQQVQAYQNMQKAYQQDLAKQRELVMGQIEADQTRRQGFGKQLPQELQTIYPYLSPAQQEALQTTEVGRLYTPLKGTAEGQGQVNKGKAINAGVAEVGPVETNGIPIPTKVDAVHNIQGHAPTTTVDVNKAILANKGQLIQNQSEANKLGVQPQQLQQDIEAKGLDIAVKRVQAQFAEQEKILSIKRDQLANLKGTLEYKKGLEEYKRFEQGQQLFKTLQESGALNTSDPGKQSEIQAQLGIFGIKYDPPNAKYSTIKHKDGAIYQVDNNTNMVRELINKGGKPTYGAWQALSQ